MIVNSLKHAARYESLHPRFAKAFAFLRQHDFSLMEPGRVELDGSDLFALVQSYNTMNATEKKWETHEKFIDIQYVASGTEIIGWAPEGSLEPAGDYNPDKDICFYQDGAPFTPIRLETGFFAILLPEDIHKPGCAAGLSEPIIKVVVKVRI